MTDIGFTPSGVHLSGKAIGAIVALLVSALGWAGTELFKAGAAFNTMTTSHATMVATTVDTGIRLTAVETALKRLDPNELVNRCVAEVVAKQQSFDCAQFKINGRSKCTLSKERRQ